MIQILYQVLLTLSSERVLLKKSLFKDEWSETEGTHLARLYVDPPFLPP